MFESEVRSIGCDLVGLNAAPFLDGEFSKHVRCPALGDLTEWGVGEGDVGVAGEAELDEPLPVEPPGHLLQNLDPPPVVLDQLVIRPQHRRDLLLLFNRWNHEEAIREVVVN